MAGEDGNLSLVLRGPGDLQLVREKEIGGISICVFFTDIPCRSKDPYLDRQEEVKLLTYLIPCHGPIGLRLITLSDNKTFIPSVLW